MLQGAANGRYLGAVSGRASQCLYDAEDAHELMWEPTRLLRLTLPRTPPALVVSLRNVRHGPLRTSGHVTDWRVHSINATSTPPPLRTTESIDKGGFGHGFELLERTIQFVRADSEGHYPNTWREFRFEGCCIGKLRTQLADSLVVKPREIVLSVHTGSFGRLIPLVTNLPPSTERMNIVILGATSPASSRLKYPMEEGGTNSGSPGA